MPMAESDGRRGKRGEQQQHETARRQVFGEVLIERAYVRKRLLRIHAPHQVTQRRNHEQRIALRTDGQLHT